MELPALHGRVTQISDAEKAHERRGVDMSERRIIFLHPTYDCSLDGVCRDDCYLLAGKSEEEKKVRLPDEYWVGVLHLAIEHGFEELSLPINPLRGITDVKDPLYWLRLLAPIAKDAGMVVNVTTTVEVASKFTEEDGLWTDIVALSLDSFRTGNSLDRTTKKFTKTINHLRGLGIETNCNLSFTKETALAMTGDSNFLGLLEAFDYYTVLWPKMDDRDAWDAFNASIADVQAFVDERGEGGWMRSQKEREMFSKILSPMWDGGKMIPDYCYSFAHAELQCSAGHGMLSINADGKLAICAYNHYYADVSTLEKFEWYLQEIVPRAENIRGCTLIRPRNAPMFNFSERANGARQNRLKRDKKNKENMEINLQILDNLLEDNVSLSTRLWQLLSKLEDNQYNFNRPQDVQRMLNWASIYLHQGNSILGVYWNGKLPPRYMKILLREFPELKYYAFKTPFNDVTGHIFQHIAMIIFSKYYSEIVKLDATITTSHVASITKNLHSNEYLYGLYMSVARVSDVDKKNLLSAGTKHNITCVKAKTVTYLS
jgi:hypothetical protein